MEHSASTSIDLKAERPKNAIKIVAQAIKKFLEYLRKKYSKNDIKFLEEEQATASEAISFGQEGVIVFSRKSAGITSRGTRKNNQDGIVIGKNFIALADGVGGAPDGEKCSGYALEAVMQELEGGKETKSINVLDETVKSLKRQADEGKIDKHSGTTLAIVQIKNIEEKVVIDGVHTGDSQVLIIDRKNKKVIYESSEQTEKGMKNKIPPSDSPQKYEGNSYGDEDYLVGGIDAETGISKYTKPETIDIKGEKGEIVIVLNCDGISKLVSPEEICDIVCNRRKTPEQMVRAIEQMAIQRHMSHEIQVKVNGVMHQVKRELAVRDNTSCVVMLA